MRSMPIGRSRRLFIGDSSSIRLPDEMRIEFLGCGGTEGGQNERLKCRLIAVRVPEEMAHRRRHKARDKARKRGSELSAEYSELLAWSLFVTNASGELLTWKEVVVLYRAG